MRPSPFPRVRPSPIVMENRLAIRMSDEDDHEAEDEASHHEVLIPRGHRY